MAYPTKPADYDAYMAALTAKLREPGRMAEFMKTGKSKPAETGTRLPDVRRPALVIMGTLDPDFEMAALMIGFLKEHARA